MLRSSLAAASLCALLASGSAAAPPRAPAGAAATTPPVFVISGRGSTWNSNGHLGVGQSGAASVRVRDGASLTTRTLAIGVDADARFRIAREQEA